jgi:hypothetical protein
MISLCNDLIDYDYGVNNQLIIINYHTVPLVTGTPLKPAPRLAHRHDPHYSLYL